MKARRDDPFVAMAIHELRTPLNGLLGFLGLLAAEPLPAGQRECVAAMERCGVLLRATVDDLLAYAQALAPGSAAEAVPYDPHRCLEEAAEPFRLAAARKGLAFRVEADGAVPGRVRGDPLRVRQVVGTLLSNAIKFTPCGEVALRLAVGPAGTAGGPTLAFEVRDTGPGMAPETLARLFEPFFRGPAAEGTEGSGLGLAMAREVAGRLGGTIEVASGPGRGTLFRLRLPLASP